MFCLLGDRVTSSFTNHTSLGLVGDAEALPFPMALCLCSSPSVTLQPLICSAFSTKHLSFPAISISTTSKTSHREMPQSSSDTRRSTLNSP
ncbi:hypothetical protein DL546_001744 [Coniochaeta pulveracea]|uniref:Uncharacterized protein n=1 Tax=Coniochaeta pulveracea TaxID=177199 RepID=A0A420Y0A9_9PEZI|nr:hypothetical protein DL546_001744 [Coniochaeta pulveracea]